MRRRAVCFRVYTWDKKGNGKGNDGPAPPESVLPDTAVPTQRSTLSWEKLKDKLAEAVYQSTDVDIMLTLGAGHPAADISTERSTRAGLVAKDVLDATGCRFNQQDKRSVAGASNANVFLYHCAQREGKQTKPKTYTDNPAKERGRGYMTRFKCGGSLRCTINDDDPYQVRIDITHAAPHIPYTDISSTDRMREIVRENKDLSASMVSPVLTRIMSANLTQRWTEKILPEYPETDVTERQIYALWMNENQDSWKLDDDHIISAQNVIEKHVSKKEVLLVSTRSEPGMAALAFALKEALEQWAEQSLELAFDGTYKSTTYEETEGSAYLSLSVNNKAAGYELSILVAEGNGQVLGFIFATPTDGTATTGAKEQLLEEFFAFFARRSPNVKFTHTDKEKAEIDAPTSPCRLCLPPYHRPYLGSRILRD